MNPQPGKSLPTRRSLLSRIKSPENDAGWREFYTIYRHLVYDLARRAGLNEAEAEDVVQDTFCHVAKKIPEFRYDPAIGSFKGWLLHTAHWHIKDQFRDRCKGGALKHHTRGRRRTKTVERIPDPQGCVVDARSEASWKAALQEAALERVKRRVKPKQYQAFYLRVFKEMPIESITALLGFTPSQVYLAKLRISRLVAEEVKRLLREGFA